MSAGPRPSAATSTQRHFVPVENAEHANRGAASLASGLPALRRHAEPCWTTPVAIGTTRIEIRVAGEIGGDRRSSRGPCSARPGLPSIPRVDRVGAWYSHFRIRLRSGEIIPASRSHARPRYQDFAPYGRRIGEFATPAAWADLRGPGRKRESFIGIRRFEARRACAGRIPPSRGPREVFRANPHKRLADGAKWKRDGSLPSTKVGSNGTRLGPNRSSLIISRIVPFRNNNVLCEIVQPLLRKIEFQACPDGTTRILKQTCQGHRSLVKTHRYFKLHSGLVWAANAQFSSTHSSARTRMCRSPGSGKPWWRQGKHCRYPGRTRRARGMANRAAANVDFGTRPGTR